MKQIARWSQLALSVLLVLTFLIPILPVRPRVAGAESGPAARPYEVHLLSGVLQPDAGIDQTVLERLLERAAAALERGQTRVHALVQFHAIPTPEEREELAAAGLELQQYVPYYTWMVSLPADRPVETLNQPLVRWVGDWSAAEKLHPRLAAGEIGPWAVDTESDRVHLFVDLHADAALAAGVALVQGLGGIIPEENAWADAVPAWLPRSAIDALATSEMVEWIEEYPAPIEVVNDGAQQAMGVPTLQGPSYSLDGSGVDVFVYDGGRARTSHIELDDHISSIDSDGFSDHPTHVACTVAGDGSGVARAEGMAPGAWILTAGFSPGSGTLFRDSYGDMLTEYTAARNTGAGGHVSDMATNSIGSNIASNGYDCAYEGDYGVSSTPDRPDGAQRRLGERHQRRVHHHLGRRQRARRPQRLAAAPTIS